MQDGRARPSTSTMSNVPSGKASMDCAYARKVRLSLAGSLDAYAAGSAGSGPGGPASRRDRPESAAPGPRAVVRAQTARCAAAQPVERGAAAAVLEDARSAEVERLQDIDRRKRQP